MLGGVTGAVTYARNVPGDYWLLLLANVVYATSYVATRLTLDDVPPATLGLLRLAIGSLVLVPLARRARAVAGLSGAERWSVAWMGILGFGAAFALSHWGIARSTATNAALLIIVEPVSLVLLSPLILGERLDRRGSVGAVLALVGVLLVVVNGIPGITRELAPYWRGDLLLVLSGLAYASYTLLGRAVLTRHPALPITARSIVWGTVSLLPLAGAEWQQGLRPVWSPSAVAGTLYLAVVITALAYLLWNYALERVEAPRAAVFLCVQPIVGALLGAALLGEPVTVFTTAGGILIVAGVILAAGQPVTPGGPAPS
jgi:drug/metabolite transporter (DMT)-like permease